LYLEKIIEISEIYLADVVGARAPRRRLATTEATFVPPDEGSCVLKSVLDLIIKL
jgi:hypothetical protein